MFVLTFFAAYSIEVVVGLNVVQTIPKINKFFYLTKYVISSNRFNITALLDRIFGTRR